MSILLGLRMGQRSPLINIVRLHRTPIVNLQTRTVEPLLPELQFVIHNVEWSPDGKQLAFAGVACIKNQPLSF